jgi:hypothetical protein
VCHPVALSGVVINKQVAAARMHDEERKKRRIAIDEVCGISVLSFSD